jgi:hypothetical protein
MPDVVSVGTYQVGLFGEDGTEVGLVYDGMCRCCAGQSCLHSRTVECLREQSGAVEPDDELGEQLVLELTVDQRSHGSRETLTRTAPSVGGTGPRRSLRSVMVRATVVPGTSQWLACSLHVKRFLPEDHNSVQLEVAQAARERRGRADKRRATRPGLQRGRLRRPRVSMSMSLHSDSKTPASSCIFDCVPHLHAGCARLRKVEHKGLATRHGLQRERLRHPRVGIIMSLHSDTKTPVTTCITDCAPHFCRQRR